MQRLPAIEAGTRYGKLTVLDVSPLTHPKNGYQYRCQCDCGTLVDRTPSTLKRGVYSCGCSTRARQRAGQLRHGESRIRGVRNGTPEYRTWRNMIIRCYDHNSRFFRNYGGRGILVCNRWRHSYGNFLFDMGRRPSAQYSIDRRDNKQGYAPENCYWATRAEQNLNKRNTLWIEDDIGHRIAMKTWAAQHGVSYRALRAIYLRRRIRVLSVHDVPSS